jgi:hypothetical protein
VPAIHSRSFLTSLGYYSYNFRRMGGMQDLFGQLWKEYSLSDSRYQTQNAFVLCMETITAVRLRFGNRLWTTLHVHIWLNVLLHVYRCVGDHYHLSLPLWSQLATPSGTPFKPLFPSDSSTAMCYTTPPACSITTF